MSVPYLGEIRIFAGNFAPRGWAMCNGALMSISENDSLFNLIGTTYGGDGQVTFGIPDLRGRLPLHTGSSYVLGQQAGSESVTLAVTQIPAHEHHCAASTANGLASNPTGALLAQGPQIQMYIEDAQDASLSPSAVGADGGNQPHENRMPFMAINYIIALEGIYPTQN